MQAVSSADPRPLSHSALARNPVARLLGRRLSRQPGDDTRRGAVAVEMAVVMTFIFVPMLLGIIEFGRVMMVGQIVTSGSRYGVRHAILDGTTNDEVEEIVRDYITSSLNVPANRVQVDITITPDGANPTPGDVIDAQRRDLVEVEVGVPWNDVALIRGNYLTGKTISSTAAMRHE